MEEALSFRLAGEMGEEVYEGGLTDVHYDRALDWVHQELRKRRKAFAETTARQCARRELGRFERRARNV
jgi:hypothetical protein